MARSRPASWRLRVGAAPDALSRLLSAAAVYGLVRKDAAGRFALTPASDLLRTDADGSARGVAVGFLGPPLLAERRAPGRDRPQPRAGEPGRAGRASTSTSAGIRRRRPGSPGPWPGSPGSWWTSCARAGFRPLASGRIVDVGGSRGTVLAYLLGALPSAHGVLMDRAEALAEAPGFLAEAGVGDRVELVVGDFLREVPPGGDLYVLSQILHNWDDEHARTHRRQLPPGEPGRAAGSW